MEIDLTQPGPSFYALEQAVRKDLHVFRRDGRWFAYGKTSGLVLQLSAAQAEAWGRRGSVAGGPVPCRSGDIYALTILEIARLLAVRKVVGEGLGPVRSFLVLVTDECNLACTYCYCRFAPAPRLGPMTRETAEQVVRTALALDVSHLAFFGGEPLLNLPAIATILEAASKSGAGIGFSMTTNATRITAEIADLLARAEVRVSVSIDGPREVHDVTRVYPDGRGSHADVVRGIELLRRRSILDLVEITHSARHPAALSAVVRAMMGWGCPITCSCVEGAEDAPFAADIVRGDRLKTYYDELLRGLGEPDGNAGTVSGAGELLAALRSETAIRRPYICSGVMTRATIAPDGRIFPCPETMNEEYCFGSVAEANLPQRFAGQRERALDRLRRGPSIRRHWFGDLVDTCIVRLRRRADGDLEFTNPGEISDCLEHVLSLMAEITPSGVRLERADANG